MTTRPWPRSPRAPLRTGQEYVGVGPGKVRRLLSKEVAVSLAARSREVTIPYGMIHEDDLAFLQEGEDFERIRVQEWLVKKRELA